MAALCSSSAFGVSDSASNWDWQIQNGGEHRAPLVLVRVQTGQFWSFYWSRLFLRRSWISERGGLGAKGRRTTALPDVPSLPDVSSLQGSPFPLKRWKPRRWGGQEGRLEKSKLNRSLVVSFFGVLFVLKIQFVQTSWDAWLKKTIKEENLQASFCQLRKSKTGTKKG